MDRANRRRRCQWERALLEGLESRRLLTTFALSADLGESQGLIDNANLAKSWNPAFIATAGDTNNDHDGFFDDTVGVAWHDWVHPYVGNKGPGSTTGNRFWPAVGNHDYVGGTSLTAWHNYFTLPGNERYYNVRIDDIELFMVNSNEQEPDGITANSVQAQWLQGALAASSATWKLVIMHHPAFSSGWHGDTSELQWPYQQWGADAVFNGHDHDYERVMKGTFPYFTIGLGGTERRDFEGITNGSTVRYNADWGIMRGDSTPTTLTFRFYQRTGTLIDTYVINKPGGNNVNLIPTNASWKYRDTGQDLGTTWRNLGFDDSAWSSGNAELGYGDGGEGTVVSYGPNENQKFITTYFRKSFNVADPGAIESLTLNLLRDDGAVVYLNGTEVFRSNMPAGTINFSTLASSNVGGGDETTFFPASISTSLLQAGSNIIAVEVHQSVADSTDLSFNFSLSASTTTSQTVAAPSGLGTSVVSASQINLTWTDNSNNEANFILERSPNGSTGWTEIATPGVNATSYSNTTGLTAGNTYYYRIRATNGTVQSANSNIASASLTGPNAPTGLAASAASASQINLTWTDASNNESGFILERSTSGTTGWAQIATPPANAISYQDGTGLSANKRYYYRIRATNVIGVSGNSATAAATTNAANNLPSPWISADFGSPGAAGSASHALGTYTITGAGDLSSTATDSAHFAHVPVSGDVTIIARVMSITGGNTNSYAGIMIRESNAPGARTAAVLMGKGNNLIGYVYRTTANTTNDADTASATFPVWLRLTRVGNVFTAYTGPDGVNWPTIIGSETIAMPAGALIGITASGNAIGVSCTATIANVTIASLPTAPSGLAASAASASQIDLTWTDAAYNETGTKIERSPNGTTGWTPIAVVDADITGYSDTTVSAGLQYFYRIRSTNGVGDSAYSATANATTSLTWAFMTGSTLNIQFDGTATPITLASSGGNILATRGATTQTFAGVVAIAALGTGNADALQINGPVTPTLSFNNGNGADSIRLMSGSHTFASDLSPSLANIAVTIDAGASATFNSTQHLANLIVSGSASLSPGGGKVLVTQALSVTGTLDLKDNDLVLDYSTLSPVGTWLGSLYDGVTGMVAAGRITSSSAAPGFTGIGVAEALQAAPGGVFSNQTVDSSAVLVKFTYLGDTNLDGKLNIDDYTNIDQSVGLGLRNWFNGDFNFDGKINIDDYTIIDQIIGNQNGVIL